MNGVQINQGGYSQQSMDKQIACNSPTLVFTPLYLANDPAITPELSFRHIADFWQVTFTGGLSTVLGSGVLEVSANPAGLPLPIQRAQESEIRRLHPMDSFRRVYPYQQGYDSVTDGSVSRWSFHTACIDPNAPAHARCRKNIVVRSFVFF